MGRWFLGCVIGYVLAIGALMYANTAVLHFDEGELGWDFDWAASSIAYAPLTVVAFFAACAVPLPTWGAGLLMCAYFAAIVVVVEVTWLMDVAFLIVPEWLVLSLLFFVVSVLIVRNRLKSQYWPIA